MITKEIFIGLLIFNMVLAAILIIAFDGLMLYLKGIRLLDDEFIRLTKYKRFSFHVFEVTRISIVVSIVIIFLFL